MNQSKLKVTTCSWREARENVWTRHDCFCFYFWLGENVWSSVWELKVDHLTLEGMGKCFSWILFMHLNYLPRVTNIFSACWTCVIFVRQLSCVLFMNFGRSILAWYFLVKITPSPRNSNGLPHPVVLFDENVWMLKDTTRKAKLDSNLDLFFCAEWNIFSFIFLFPGWTSSTAALFPETL